MSFVSSTRDRCPELAEFLDGCCKQRLAFEGDEPNRHSAQNHIHLWALEYWAERCAWIYLDYRVAFVREIFRQWRTQLRGLPPYQSAGYRLYLYEDLAPTVSVVAETPAGFPYDRAFIDFVAAPADVMRPYLDRKWSGWFQSLPWPIPRERVLDAVDAHAGSIGQPTADALGLGVGALRRLIEEMGLDREVNALRRKYARAPAHFRPDALERYTRKLYELRLPPRFR